MLMILIPCVHYFYLGKGWMNLVLWITFGGFGILWFIDVLRLGGMVLVADDRAGDIALRE